MHVTWKTAQSFTWLKDIAPCSCLDVATASVGKNKVICYWTEKAVTAAKCLTRPTVETFNPKVLNLKRADVRSETSCIQQHESSETFSIQQPRIEAGRGAISV